MSYAGVGAPAIIQKESRCLISRMGDVGVPPVAYERNGCQVSYRRGPGDCCHIKEGYVVVSYRGHVAVSPRYHIECVWVCQLSHRRCVGVALSQAATCAYYTMEDMWVSLS